MSQSLEDRISAARKANLALYLDDPSPESAKLLVTFERTVKQLHKEAATKEADVSITIPDPDWSGYPTATGTVVLSHYDVASSARQLPDGLDFSRSTRESTP